MATDKKHIAVYLDPAVEQALIAFCEQKGMVSKKGFMYSAGVNAVLAEFFGLSAEPGNTPQKLRNIPSEFNNTPLLGSNILVGDNIPTDTVTQEVTDTRISALEERIEVLQESLQESLKALWEALPGKLESGDSAELPKVDSGVAEQLQNGLGNLKTENEILKQELADARNDYAKLLESSTAVKASREKEIAEVRSQLAAVEQNVLEWQEENSDQLTELKTQREEIENLKSKIQNLESELVHRSGENSEKSAAASELPEAADLYNQLKARRKKSKADLGDVEAILEMIEES
jgi:chromosome segregation ATPase